jgi:hypothetical protein
MRRSTAESVPALVTVRTGRQPIAHWRNRSMVAGRRRHEGFGWGGGGGELACLLGAGRWW